MPLTSIGGTSSGRVSPLTRTSAFPKVTETLAPLFVAVTVLPSGDAVTVAPIASNMLRSGT